MSEWVEGVCRKLESASKFAKSEGRSGVDAERGCQVFRDIASKVQSAGRELKEGDYKYVYREDGSKVKLGKFLRGLDEKLSLDYGNFMQSVKFEKRELGGILKISQDPEDILARSTCQRWGSCATIGGGMQQDVPGIFADIRQNNAVSYLSLKGEENDARTRRMLRWCIRKDDGKPDVFIEKCYGESKYCEPMKDKLIKVLRSKGFSAIPGNVGCFTIDEYPGYSDAEHHGQASRVRITNEHIEQYNLPESMKGKSVIEYRVGDRL